MRMPYITAHSGCEGTPRDSLESVERAVRLGADIVEMDVRRGPDGVLRVSHDPLTGEGYEKKPPLEAVFLRLRGTGLSLNCDMKEPAALYGALDMAASFGFDRERLILSGCASPEQIARDPALTRRARLYVNVEEILKLLYFQRYQTGFPPAFQALMADPWPALRSRPVPEAWLEEVVRFARTFRVQGVNLPFRLLTDAFAEKLRKAGVPFSVWTVNEPEELRRCVRAGAENITTLEVRMALEERARLRGRRAEPSGPERPDA